MAKNPDIGQLYVKMTDPRVSADGRTVTLPGVLDMIGKLSVTSQFKLSLHLTRTAGPKTAGLIDHLDKAGILEKDVDVISYDFLCSDASLPGLSLNTFQEMGSHQGSIEKFPTVRIFPQMDVTFYVDSEFKVIRLFEEWMNYINPLYNFTGQAIPSPQGLGNYTMTSDFFRLRYPEEYKRIISITIIGRILYRMVSSFLPLKLTIYDIVVRRS